MMKFQAKAKQRIAENMRQDFEKDREKMKRQIQLDFEKEKEERARAAEKQKTELEKNIDLSIIPFFQI